ncbi:tetratricopeptide repeat protein, partial [Streptomyces sp. MCAF7]
QVRCLFGELHLRTGRLESAERGFHWALRIARDDEDRIGEARALYGLGLVRRGQGWTSQARMALEQAREIARQAGDHDLEERLRRSLSSGAALSGGPGRPTGRVPGTPGAEKRPVPPRSRGEHPWVLTASPS